MIRNALRLTTESWGLTAGFRLGLIGFLLCWSVMGKSQELKPVDPPDEEGLPILIAPDETQPETKKKAKPAESQPKKDATRKDAKEATEADRKKAASENKPVEDAKPTKPAEKPAAPKTTEPVVPKPMDMDEPKVTPEVTPPPMPTPDPLKSVDPGADAAPENKPPVKEEPPAEPGDEENVAQEPTRDENVEQWTMLITSGPSHVAGTRPQHELVTFDLDPETKRMVGGPDVQPLGHDEAMAAVEQSQKTQGESKRSISPAQYQAVYNSIPFSRAEYLANPSYRHEATMEMLFGELRPTVIHKQDKPQRVYNQPQITEPPVPHPIPFNWYSPAYGYGPASYFGWRYPYWTPNSTYRRYPTQYGPLFYRYYRPLGY